MTVVRPNVCKRFLAASLAAAVALQPLTVEAAAILEKTPGSEAAQARVSAELMELYFLRLRLRLDPERDPPAFAEADVVRRQFAQARARFKNTELKLRDADIDVDIVTAATDGDLAHVLLDRAARTD